MNFRNVLCCTEFSFLLFHILLVDYVSEQTNYTTSRDRYFYVSIAEAFSDGKMVKSSQF